MMILKNYLTDGSDAPNRNEGGSATVIFIALLAIMMILVSAEARALFHLRCEVKLLEQQQMKRLNIPSTNSVVSMTSQIK
jgi:hypothetical protein